MSESFQNEDGRWVMRFERVLAHAPDKVWRVLTEPEELSHWFPAAIEGPREPGAALRFVFAGSPGPAQNGTMRVFEPPRLLEYSWAGEVLRWELVSRDDGRGCTLLFTHIIEERASAPRTAAGWDMCLERLGARMDSGSATGLRAWPERYLEYLERFGLGAFPAFLQRGQAVAVLHGARGVAAHRFSDDAGAELLLFHAEEDAVVEKHSHDREVYLTVVAGSITLQLGGGDLTLLPGREFLFAPGLPVSGRLKQGTRGLLAVAGKQ